MLILVPLLILVAIIVAIDQFYFSNTPPQDTTTKKELHQPRSDANATQKYLDRYIKK